jgi:predicted MFS family arabinose efflux permease
MQKLAQAWLVLDLSGSAFLLGLDAFLGEIPIFLLSLVGGVVADRFDRRILLICSQVIQMTSAFILAALLALGAVHVWHILVLSFCSGVGQAFGGPAYQALLPALVERDDLPNAIAMNSIQFNLARVIGPMVGGLAMSKLGATWCFSLNGLSFIAVIAALIVVSARYNPARSSDTILQSMKQGISFIRKHGAMESMIALAFFSAVFGVPTIIFLPVFARDVLHGNADTFTLLLSVSGAGSVFGALLVATMGRARRLGLPALIFLCVLGATTAGFALSKILSLSCVVLFLNGALQVAVFSLFISLMQLQTANEMRGRVMSVYNVAFRGGMPIGNLLTGTLVPLFSAPLVIALNGAVLTLLGISFLTVNRRVAAL